MVAGQKGKDAASPPNIDKLVLNEPRAIPPTKLPPPLSTHHRTPPTVAPGADLESASEDEDEEDDEDNPFADKNVVATPAVERREPKW